MKKLLLILSFTLGLTTAASANDGSMFRTLLQQDPSYSDCVEAIENGVVISIRPNGAHVFFYKDKIYTISAAGERMYCLATEKLR